MNHHCRTEKTRRRSAELKRRGPAPGAKGVAIAPPAYGIDFVDRGLTARAPVPVGPLPVTRPVRGAGPGAAVARQAVGAGLPAPLRLGIEALSGIDLSDVRVHADSAEPARFHALAYAGGRDIHVGPGQEGRLPHESWHLVQQRQGRVGAAARVGGVSFNLDQRLEREADAMGVAADRAGRAIGPRGANTEAVASGRGANGPAPPGSGVVQFSVADLEEWKDGIWDSVSGQLSDAVFDVIESVNQQEIEDTEGQDPGGFLQNKYEAEVEAGGMDITPEEQFTDEERGGINTVGLRTQLDAVSDAARGRALEIEFARKNAVENRHWIQVGAIGGQGGDISVRAGDKWSDARTYQFKSTRSETAGAVDAVIRKAAAQLRGDHGERPYPDDVRHVYVEIVNPVNPFPGTPAAKARGTRATFLAQFRTRLTTTLGHDLTGVDVMRIHYVTPVPIVAGAAVNDLVQEMNGSGGLKGPGAVS